MDCDYCKYCHRISDQKMCAFDTRLRNMFRESDTSYISCTEFNSEGNCPYGISVNIVTRIKILFNKFIAKIKNQG